MSKSRFPITGALDKASGTTTGTLTIDRAMGILSVRPLHSREEYTLPLGDVATMVVQAVMRINMNKATHNVRVAQRRRRRVNRGVL